MPIKIPVGLPAGDTLENENVFVMTDYRARASGHPPAEDRRSSNLMPDQD